MATRFLELSRITGTDVASNIKEVTRLFGNWNVAAEEQTGMLDYLFKVSQSTGIGVDRLSTLTTAIRVDAPRGWDLTLRIQ